MYIEICKDVIEDAIVKSGQKVNDSLDLLLLFAIFSLQGKHIIVVPSLRNDNALCKELGKVMMPANVNKLRRSDRISYILPTIKNAVSTYCLVTYKDDKAEDPRALIINPLRLKMFEPYMETRLITENLLDSKFFKYIAHYYARQKYLAGIQMRFETKPGGGSSTSDVVREELLRPKRFCLVVVDGDKKQPNQNDYGDTANKVIGVIRDYPCVTCKHYIMEKVMEIENLIPNKIIRQYASDKSSCDILDKDFSYYDMKSGITLKGLYDDEIFRYWQPVMHEEHLDYSGRDVAKSHSKNRREYERYIDANGITDCIKRGFGADLLRIVTCTPEKNKLVKYPKLESIMLNTIKSEDLTPEQQIEWNNIGKLVFSWTCGLNPTTA